MITQEDILKELENGTDITDFMNDITAKVNAAKKTFEAKQKVSKEQAHKVAYMKEILNMFHTFMVKYYCKSDEDVERVNAAFPKDDAEHYVELIDSLMNLNGVMLKNEDNVNNIIESFLDLLG